MTRIKKEIPKKKTCGERIRRIPDQKKIVNNKNFKVNDINVKKFLDSIKINFGDATTATHAESNQDPAMSSDNQEVASSGDIEHNNEDEQINNVLPETASVDEATPTVEKDNVNLGTPTKEHGIKDDEEWSGVELVGLSPEVQKSNLNELQSDEKPQEDKTDDENKFSDIQEKTEQSCSSDKNNVKDENVNDKSVDDENDLEKSGEDGYNSEDEGGSDQESESELDEQRQPPVTKGYSEESESGAGSDGEKEKDKGDFTDGSYSADEEDDEIESGAENPEEKEAEIDVKSPTFVPRRTGFWDHDDRFADINVQETREPQGNRKLWDKSDVNRWQHDKYIESAQGPKEQWEVEQTVNELEERERRRRSGGRRGRNFGDFVAFGNRGSRGGRQNQRGGRGGYERRNFDNRQTKDEWTNDKDKLNWQQEGYKYDHWEDSRKRIEKDHNKDKQSFRKERIDNMERNQRFHNRRKDDEKDDVGEHSGDRKYRDKTTGSETRNTSERQEYGKKKGLGRGRGTLKDENNDKFPREKTSREKRIEQLPPRLRDNARKKLENEERTKNQNQDEEDDENFQDVSEEEIKSPDDGVPRDKPKRYSSQRQKPGTSMLDISGQIPEDEDGKNQYLDLVHQTMYNAQVLAMQQHNQNHQGMISNDNVKMLEHQILHLQNQLQQQLNLRSQAQMPSMVALPLQNLSQMQVPNVDQQGQVYGGDPLAYNLNQALMQNNTGGVAMPNPQINPVILNQIMAAAGVQTQQSTLPMQGSSGLFVPPMQPAPQQHHMQVTDAEQHPTRRSRPAAIPIKPPPGL